MDIFADAGDVAGAEVEIRDIRRACGLGRQARITAATLAGDAAGHTTLDTVHTVLGLSLACANQEASRATQELDDTRAAEEDNVELPAVLTDIAAVIEPHEIGWITLDELAARADGYGNTTALGTALADAGFPIGHKTKPLRAKKRLHGAPNPVSAFNLDCLHHLTGRNTTPEQHGTARNSFPGPEQALEQPLTSVNVPCSGLGPGTTTENHSTAGAV